MFDVGYIMPYRFSQKENIGETPESDIMIILCSDVRCFVQCRGTLND
jgi:hypothetical protein